MSSDTVRGFTVLVYSDDPAVVERIELAVGRRPAPGIRVDYVEAFTGDEVVARVDAGGVDLLMLDAEAWPTGGMGLSRQLKNEISGCPAICLVLARGVDRWLATWAQADVVVAHPLDPVAVADTVAGVLRQRAGVLPVSR